MKQDQIGDEEDAVPDAIQIYFKEIQSDGLHTWTFDQIEEIENIQKVIRGLDRKTNTHDFSKVNLDRNVEMWVDHLLSEYPDHMEEFCNSLVHDFSKSMMTRAREAGKYAVLILSSGMVIVCHTDSEEMSLTKEAEVIERLLDTDNVTKFAKFTGSDDGTLVHEFERSQNTKSFSNWIGLEPEQIAYESAGEIQIFTEIENSTVSWDYTLNEFEDKFLENDDFQLVGDFLFTPSGKKYPVSHVSLGRKIFNNVDEFKQEYHALYYDLAHYHSHYDTLTNSINPYQTPHFDHENKVTKGATSGETLILKRNEGFKVIYANKTIELAARWRHTLTENFRNNEQVRLHHAGMGFTEEPTFIGPFEIYNKIEIDEEHINQLYNVTQEAATGGHLSNIIHSVIFHTLSKWTPSPISHFFKQMTQTFEVELDAEGMVLRDEDRIVEYKSRDWVVEEDNDAIARKITEEIQEDAKLILVGIEDNEQRIRPIKRSNFESERNQQIRDSLQEMNNQHDSIDLAALQLGDGECLLFIYSIRGDQEFDLGMDVQA